MLQSSQLTNPDPSILHEDDCVRIAFSPGETNAEAIISFTGIGLQMGGIQQHEFSSTLSGRRDIYYITDFRRSWFNDCAPVIRKIVCKALAKRGTKTVVTLGNSMGGSGAIAFAREFLGCQTAIAFVPQSSISPQVVSFEHRYRNFAAEVKTWRLPDLAECISPEITYQIFVGDQVQADLDHAERFRRACPASCNVYVIPNADHNVARYLKRNGITLADLIVACEVGKAEVTQTLSLLTSNTTAKEVHPVTLGSPRSIPAAQVTKDMRNEIELQIFGLQRSGNHGVISWITQQFIDKVYFFNNVSHFGDPVTSWHEGKVPNTHPLPQKSARAELEDIRSKPKSVLIYSYENLRLIDLANQPLLSNHVELLGRSARFHRVLLLRDFFNWISSRLKLFDYRGKDTLKAAKNIDGLINLWLLYAREFAGETAYLGNSDIVKVAYPRWVDDAEYRAWILGAIGIPLNDNSNGYVPDVGGGSSFDLTIYSGSAGNMAVSERWEFFLNDERFTTARKRVQERRSEIELLNESIFRVPWVL
jgi:hypothetical protein